MKMSSAEEQLMNAVGCAILKFQKADDTNDLICEYGNEEAEKILGKPDGRSWNELSGAYSLPLRFNEEVLNLPGGKIYQVIKRKAEDGGYVFTLLDASPESKANKEIEDFLFIASHDLQEPLRKIISFGERIERNKEALGEENSMYLTRMMSATGRMQNMLTGLLSFSRIEQQAGTFAECDLSEIVQDAFQSAVQLSGRQKVKFSPGKLPVVEANRSLLHQLFREVFSNALKFQPKDGVVEIIVSSEVDLLHKNVKISVIDNGIGFDNEHADRVFLLFHRLNGRAEYEGGGIGLAVARKIAEAHSGEIKAYSAPGKGTTIEIRLPLAQGKGRV